MRALSFPLALLVASCSRSPKSPPEPPPPVRAETPAPSASAAVAPLVEPTIAPDVSTLDIALQKQVGGSRSRCWARRRSSR